MDVSVGDAKNNLSEYIKKVEAGEEVTICRHGKPVVTLVKAKPKKRVLGSARGLIQEIDPDWWKPMTDEEVGDFHRGDY